MENTTNRGGLKVSSVKYRCADCFRPILNLSNGYICRRLDDEGNEETVLLDSDCAMTMHMQGIAIKKPIDHDAEAAHLDEAQESHMEAKRGDDGR